MTEQTAPFALRPAAVAIEADEARLMAERDAVRRAATTDFDRLAKATVFLMAKENGADLKSSATKAEAVRYLADKAARESVPGKALAALRRAEAIEEAIVDGFEAAQGAIAPAHERLTEEVANPRYGVDRIFDYASAWEAAKVKAALWGHVAYIAETMEVGPAEALALKVEDLTTEIVRAAAYGVSRSSSATSNLAHEVSLRARGEWIEKAQSLLRRY